jgi:hypothetical protein
MVRKMGELPNFLVFNSKRESFVNSSIFALSLLLFALYSFCISFSESILLRISDVFVVVFLDKHGQLPHFYLAEDGRLCSMVQHCPRFPRVLYDTLLCLGYKGDAPIHRCWLSMAHGVKVCEARVTIPIHPSEPWSGSIFSSRPDTAVEMMAHTALTYLSESRLTATAALPTALRPIWNQENPM